MRKRDQWIRQIKAVEAEHRLAAYAVAQFQERVRTEPSVLPGRLKPADLSRTADNLEATYFVRMFAVFEAGLRQAWRVALGRDTAPPMRDLLDGFTATQRIDHDVSLAAHEVRGFRNALVHEQDEQPETSLTLGRGLRHLTRFFSYLPPDW